MLRATAVRAANSWRDAPADTVVLEFDDRHRRRMAMTGTRGLAFLLDLAETVALRGGDALVLEDGRLVEVVAAPEPLIELRGVDPRQMVRLAWHLGNRHLPVQIAGKHLRIRRDHVIEEMVKGLGASVVEIEAPFDPEGGAYASGGHDHQQDHHHGGHDHGVHDHHHHDGGDDHHHQQDHRHVHHDHHHHHDEHGHSHDHADHGHDQDHK